MPTRDLKKEDICEGTTVVSYTGHVGKIFYVRGKDVVVKFTDRGGILFQGNVDEFLEKFDKVLISIK